MNRPTAHSDFLGRTAIWMRQQESAILSLGGDMVKQDMRVCRKQALFGAEWAKRRTRIQAQVLKKGMSEAEWTKRETGIDISEMRRRVRLYRKWNRYEAVRRQVGYERVGELPLYVPEAYLALPRPECSCRVSHLSRATL